MPKLLHSIAVPETLVGADGLFTFDLAVNPLSVVLINLRPLNDTGTLSNYQNYLRICQAINRASILYLGQNVLSMRGEDIAAMNWLRHGICPWEANSDNVNDERRCVVLPLFLGKQPYDLVSCFPATKRGELVLELDLDIADTGYDGLRLSIDTKEILGISPKEYEKKTTVTQTMAVGTNDVDLQPRNKCRGVLLFGTTGFGGAAPAPTWGRVRCLVDNTEQAYAAIDWETLIMEPALWGRVPTFIEHKHTLNAAGAGVEETTSVFDIDDNWTNYAFLDFDPTRDDTFSLDLSSATRFQIRNEAEAADAARAMQIEVIKV